MSKRAKAAQKLKRLQKKRARKAANTAKYAALRDSGQNTKSKRSLSQNKKSKRVNTVSHQICPCCNI